MNRNQAAVFFKIESNIMTQYEMDIFARQHILEADPDAQIHETSSQQGAITYKVITQNFIAAEKIIHELNYKQFRKCKTLAMWNNQTPKHEILVEGAPANATRRDFFLAMEPFGPIGRVTPNKSLPGSAWVVFLYPNSVKEAVASQTKIGDKVVSIKPIIGFNFNQKKKNQKKVFTRQQQCRVMSSSQ